MKLSSAHLNALSPAEKLDLLLGRTDLADATTATQSAVRANAGKKDWEGVCNGWAEAALLVKPLRLNVVRRLPGGKEITFFPLDVQALVSRFYADLQKTKYRCETSISVSAKCSEGCKRSGDGCVAENGDFVHTTRYQGCHGATGNGGCTAPVPVTADAFHIATTRMLSTELAVGRFGRHGLIVDVSTEKGEIWNQPVIGVDFKYAAPVPIAAPGPMRHRLHVVATMKYVHEGVEYVEGGADTKKNSLERLYEYDLIVDDNDRIVRGAKHEWAVGTRPPAQLWFSESSLPARVEREKLAAASYPIPWDALVDLITAAGGEVISPVWDGPKLPPPSVSPR